MGDCNTAIKDCRRVVLARELVSSYGRKAQNVLASMVKMSQYQEYPLTVLRARSRRNLNVLY